MNVEHVHDRILSNIEHNGQQRMSSETIELPNTIDKLYHTWLYRVHLVIGENRTPWQ
jgi:hypothetical protein